jgi:hypothetical protein
VRPQPVVSSVGGDEAEAEPVEAGISELLELAGDRLGIPHHQQPAIARAIARAQVFRLRARHRPLIGGTEIEVDHGVDGAVVAARPREQLEPKTASLNRLPPNMVGLRSISIQAPQGS